MDAAAGISWALRPVVTHIDLSKFAAVLAIAWLLTYASNSMLYNLPAAAMILAVLMLQGSGRQHGSYPATPCTTEAKPVERRWVAAASPLGDCESWRGKVQSKIVEYAWEKLCSSIVQQWVYSTWYAALTPDKQFPAAVRDMLNTAFAEVCVRAATVDVKALFIRDVSRVLCDNIELYRATQAAVGPAQLAALLPAARERALQREMRAMGNLHVALCTPEGHYTYLTALAEGLLQQLLQGPDGELLRLPMGVVLRELVASCMLRPAMMFCLPHNVNKLLLSVLHREPAPSRGPAVERMLVESAQRWEQRGQASLREEADALSGLALKQQMHRSAAAGAAAKQDNAAEEGRDLRHSSTSLGASGSARRVRSGSLEVSKDRSPGDAAALNMSASSGCLLSGSGRMGTPGKASEEPMRAAASPLHAVAEAPLPPVPRPVRRVASGHRSTRSDMSELAQRWDAAAVASQASPAAGASEDESPRGLQERNSHGSLEQRGSSSQLAPKPAASLSSSWHTSAPRPVAAPSPGADSNCAGSPMSSSWHGHGDKSRAMSELALTGSGSSQDTPGVAGGTQLPRPAAESEIGTHGEERHGFVGYPRASVVAPETHVESGFAGAMREFIMYKVRVTDGGGEWTIARRFRNFEALHVLLQQRNSLYRELRLTPPTKRMFYMTHDGAFVHQRRKELDVYIKRLLSHPGIALSGEVWQFLRPGSEAYYNFSHNPLQSLFGNNGLPPTDRKPPRSELTAASSGGGSVSAAGAAGGAAGGGTHRRRGSGASDDFVFVRQGASGGGPSSGVESPDKAPGAGASSSMASLSGLGVAKVPARPSSQQAQGAGWPKPEQGAGPLETYGAGEVLEEARPTGPGTAAPGGTADTETVGGGNDPARFETSARTTDLLGQPAPDSSGLALSGTSEPGTPPSNNADQQLHSQSSAHTGALPHRRTSSSSFSPHSTLEEQQLQYAEALGASDPLLDVVDTVFELQGRGFLWRQASMLARQTLSLLAGDAIDRFCIYQLKALTSELRLARLILGLHSALWPGGVWFAWANQQQQQRAEAAKQQQQQQQQEPASAVPRPAPTATIPEPWIPTWSPAPQMRPETFLEPATLPPDGAETSRKVLELLNSRAPATLVRILGQRNYATSMQELHGMLQSTTFTLQIGYGILEAVIRHTFPELRSLLGEDRKAT